MAFDPRNLNPPRYRNEEEVGTGTVTSLSAGTGITLTPSPITGTGSIALETLGPDPSGTYGDATNVSQITVDAQGRVTAAADVPVSIPYSVAEMNTLFFDATALGVGADADIPGLTLTLAPGTYQLGYTIALSYLPIADSVDRMVRFVVTDASNVAIPRSATVYGARCFSVADRERVPVNHQFFHVLASTTTLKMRFVQNPSAAAEFFISTGNSYVVVTDPDFATLFWAMKLA